MISNTTVDRSAYQYQPWKFFSLVAVFSWLPWLVAIYCSNSSELVIAASILMLLGLLGPCLATAVMLCTLHKYNPNSAVIHDIKYRIKDISAFKSYKLWGILLLIIIVLFLATTISIMLGRSAEQFQFSPNFFAMLPVALIAALLEEFAWRSYGVDSIKERFSWLKTTLIFYVLWASWHLPLFFIQGTYQYGLWDIGTIYVANFFISMLPATIIANWLFFKTNRSIYAVVMFHFILVATAELLQTQQFTKCIITILLFAVSGLLIVNMQKQK